MTTPLRRFPASRRPYQLTFYDAVQHLLADSQLSSRESNAVSAARRAVRYAAGNLCALHRWKAYLSHTLVKVHGSYTMGTVAYNATTGQATITDGVWPDWSAFGELRINDQEWPVVERVSDAVVELDPAVRPTSDISSTAYTLLQRRAPLPADVRAIGRVIEVDDEYELLNLGANALFDWQSQFNETSGTQDFSLVTGDRRFFGLALEVAPAPTETTVYRMVYDRYPQVPQHYAIETTVTSEVAGALTGTKVAFSDSLVGAIVRTSESSTVPDLFRGDGSFTGEGVVIEVVDSDTIRTDPVLPSGAARISDPVDALPGPMAEALLALAKLEMHEAAGSERTRAMQARFDRALAIAQVDDQRYNGPIGGALGVAGGRSTIGEVNVNP